MIRAVGICSTALTLFYTHASCCGVKVYNARCEELFDVAAFDHLLGGEQMELRWRDKGY